VNRLHWRKRFDPRNGANELKIIFESPLEYWGLNAATPSLHILAKPGGTGIAKVIAQERPPGTFVVAAVPCDPYAPEAHPVPPCS
jgi:hypothetical protein